MSSQNAPKQGAKRITLIGAGNSGTSIAVMLVALHDALRMGGAAFPALHIDLMDGNGSFGPGTAYATGGLTNQPACFMSPYPDAPDHFVHYLERRHPGDKRHSFEKRCVYGAYSAATLGKAAQYARQGGGVTLAMQSVVVHHVAYDTQHIVATDAGLVAADEVVLVDGHFPSTKLAEWQDHDAFFNGGYEARDVVKALLGNGHPVRNIAIIGTGSSMIDILRVLDEAGYTGKIHAFSRDGIEPWEFDPGDYDDGRIPYQPVFLTADNLGASCGRYEDFEEALCKERSHAYRLGYKTGHVLGAIDFGALAACGRNGEEPEGLARFRSVFGKIYGNPTSPENYRLYTRLKKSGRLKVIRGAIESDHVAPGKNGFTLSGDTYSQVSVNLLFNGAAHSRDPFASPLIRQALAANILDIGTDGVRPGAQKCPGLYVADPPPIVTNGASRHFATDAH